MRTIKMIIIVVLCMLPLGIEAQSMMRIEFNEGKQMEIPISSVTSIKWLTYGTTTTNDMSPSKVEAVDLGLPSGLKWANMNIGACVPEDFGNYYAWGETSEIKNFGFDLSHYKWYLSITTPETTDEYGFTVPEKTIEGYTKYVTNVSTWNWHGYGYDDFYDDKSVLDLEDDVASVKWGGSWRMPTREEQEELFKVCKREWTYLNGVRGYKLTGPNNNFIFLPAAGCRDYGARKEVGTGGLYWSSTLDTDNPCYAKKLFFATIHYNDYDNVKRYMGLSVRAVCP